MPLHLAAGGPAESAPRREIADWVILLSGVSPRTLAAATARVGEGADAAGRSAGKLPVTVSALCELTDDIEADARLIKPICASIAQNDGAFFLALVGIDGDVPAMVGGGYPDLVHAEEPRTGTFPRGFRAGGGGGTAPVSGAPLPRHRP